LPVTARVKVDSKNRLIVRKLTLDGVWSLTPGHDLKFRVLGSDGELSGKTLIFTGNIENVKGDSISFRIRDYQSVLGIRSGSIRLTGRWKADKYNRLTFQVSKAKSRYDTLTFQGKWEVGKNNEIIYRYSKTHLKTKKREARTLVFSGYWDIEKSRLTYRIERSSDSYFSFKAALRIKAVTAGKRKLEYTVGVRYVKERVYRKTRETVTIYGKWKVDRDLKVSFDVVYSGGKRKKIGFGVERIFKDDISLKFFLADKRGASLGLSVEFAKVFRNDAEFFLALERAGIEYSIIGGIKVRF